MRRELRDGGMFGEPWDGDFSCQGLWFSVSLSSNWLRFRGWLFSVCLMC